MELSERKIVVKNMAALVENTKVNAALLEILRSQAILSDDDLREIDSMVIKSIQYFLFIK